MNSPGSIATADTEQGVEFLAALGLTPEDHVAKVVVVLLPDKLVQVYVTYNVMNKELSSLSQVIRKYQLTLKE